LLEATSALASINKDLRESVATCI